MKNYLNINKTLTNIQESLLICESCCSCRKKYRKCFKMREDLKLSFEWKKSKGSNQRWMSHKNKEIMWISSETRIINVREYCAFEKKAQTLLSIESLQRQRTAIMNQYVRYYSVWMHYTHDVARNKNNKTNERSRSVVHSTNIVFKKAVTSKCYNTIDFMRKSCALLILCSLIVWSWTSNFYHHFEKISLEKVIDSIQVTFNHCSHA